MIFNALAAPCDYWEIDTAEIAAIEPMHDNEPPHYKAYLIGGETLDIYGTPDKPFVCNG